MPLKRKYTYIIICMFILAAFLIFISFDKLKYVDSYVITKNNLSGLINASGDKIVKPRFIYIEPIRKDGVALAVIDTMYLNSTLNIKYGYITHNDKFLFPKPSFAKIKIDLNTDSIRAFSQFCENFSFYGGLAIAQDIATMRFGYIGLNGDTIIPAKYLNARIFNQGRAAIQADRSEHIEENGKWSIIDPNGRNVCDYIFSYLETPVNNRALARISYTDYSMGNQKTPKYFIKTFLVDENGTIVKDDLNIAYQYSSFSKDGFALAMPNALGEFACRSVGFIQKDGEFIKPLNTSNLSRNQISIITESKHFLGEFLPNDIKITDATCFAEGYAAIKIGESWIFVDEELIPRGNGKHPTYEDALPFAHGLAGVKIQGKFGYIDNNFKIIIPCKYDSCAIAGENLCRVYSGEKTDKGYPIISYINRQNKIVWQNINYNDINANLSNRKKWNETFEYEYMGWNLSLGINLEKYIGRLIYVILILAVGLILFSTVKIYKSNTLNKSKQEASTKNDNAYQPNEEDRTTSNETISNELATNKRDVAYCHPNSIDERLDKLLKLKK